MHAVKSETCKRFEKSKDKIIAKSIIHEQIFLMADVMMVTFFAIVRWNWRFYKKSLFQVKIFLPDPNFKTCSNQTVA